MKKTATGTGMRLEAEDGMLLCNGKTVCANVYIHPGDSADNWKEMPWREAEGRFVRWGGTRK